MASNLSKKFALLICCLMTMQALRLVISTAGFCVTRFHIDCSLFNIFISRLVNAVMMSQLFGNWLGDLFVFALDGRFKLIAGAVANWIEFLCFCTALFSICHTECGHLTGFYWSMVCAYFWWKVSEAPIVSISAPDGTDYYYAGFTLSGVWAACLKAVVMWFISDGAKSQHFHSDALGDVNVTLVGTRSVKTTLDYRAAKWLYVITIVLTFMMCLSWTVVAALVREWGAKDVQGKLDGTVTVDTFKEAGHVVWKSARKGMVKAWATWDGTTGTVTEVKADGRWLLNLEDVTVTPQTPSGTVNGNAITYALENVDKVQLWAHTGTAKEAPTEETQWKAIVWDEVPAAVKEKAPPTNPDKTVGEIMGEKVKAVLEEVNGAENIDSVTLGASGEATNKTLTLTVTVSPTGVIEDKTKNMAVAALAGAAFGGVLAVPGAMLGAGAGWVLAVFGNAAARRDWTVFWGILGATFGVIGGVAVFVGLGTGVKEAGMLDVTSKVTAKFTGDGKEVNAGPSLVWICGGVLMLVVGLTVGGVVASVSPGETGKATKWCQLIFGIVGALGGMAAGVWPVWNDKDLNKEVQEWVVSFKWSTPRQDTTTWKPMQGLVTGIIIGVLVGTLIGVCKRSLGGGFLWGGALVGSFAGLLTGEIVNAVKTWMADHPVVKTPDGERKALVVCGYLIVVLGLGTVYSIYPGMAPCSITQFRYFNIIDILILALSAIAPIVVMGMDLAEADDRLGATILGNKTEKWWWLAVGLLLLVSTNICEIIVICVMQHPFSKMAQKVTTSGWRAVLLTVTMVTSQLTSSTVGFGCMAAGGGFNDGINNANSTLTLWTVECTGVLGEGYLTELKKYEPGMWPTQGMSGCKAYWWWWGRAFRNAWQIWCCIGTTDLRRDIMLCKQ